MFKREMFLSHHDKNVSEAHRKKGYERSPTKSNALSTVTLSDTSVVVITLSLVNMTIDGEGNKHALQSYLQASNC